MTRWMHLGISLLLFSLFVGCGDSTAGPMVVTDEQNGGSVTLARGEHMILTLPGNPSTGYEWKVPQEIQAYLTLHDSSYTPESDRIGAPGHYTFDFEAQQAGTVELVMKYARGWETGSVDTFTLTVNIERGSSADSTGEEKPLGPADPYPAQPVLPSAEPVRPVDPESE